MSVPSRLAATQTAPSPAASAFGDAPDPERLRDLERHRIDSTDEVVVEHQRPDRTLARGEIGNRPLEVDRRAQRVRLGVDSPDVTPSGNGADPLVGGEPDRPLACGDQFALGAGIDLRVQMSGDHIDTHDLLAHRPERAVGDDEVLGADPAQIDGRPAVRPEVVLRKILRGPIRAEDPECSLADGERSRVAILGHVDLVDDGARAGIDP